MKWHNLAMADDLQALKKLFGSPTIGTVAIVYGILLALAAAAGLFGIWLGILVLLSLWRFGYATLKAMAQGRDPATPGIETMSPVGELPLVLHLVLFPGVVCWYLFTTYMLADDSPSALAYGLIGLTIVVFPASAALMGINHSLPNALNPINVAGVIKGLGKRYLVLLIACAIVFICAAIAWTILIAQWNMLLAMVAYGVAVWAHLVLFGLIGVAIYSARDIFSIPGLAESKQARQQRWAEEDKRARWRSELDIIYGHWRSDAHGKANLALRKLIESEPDAREVLPWLFENTLAWRDKSCALSIARPLIRQLIADGREPDAIAIVQRCRRHADSLTLQPGDAALLAAHARNLGQLGLADEIDSWETLSR